MKRKQQGEEVDLSSLGSPHIQVWVALAPSAATSLAPPFQRLLLQHHLEARGGTPGPAALQHRVLRGGLTRPLHESVVVSHTPPADL